VAIKEPSWKWKTWVGARVYLQNTSNPPRSPISTKKNNLDKINHKIQT
jgi:hypothetical protein